jgi:hypothetical protein
LQLLAAQDLAFAKGRRVQSNGCQLRAVLEWNNNNNNNNNKTIIITIKQ